MAEPLRIEAPHDPTGLQIPNPPRPRALLAMSGFAALVDQVPSGDITPTRGLPDGGLHMTSTAEWFPWLSAGLSVLGALGGVIGWQEAKLSKHKEENAKTLTETRAITQKGIDDLRVELHLSIQSERADRQRDYDRLEAAISEMAGISSNVAAINRTVEHLMENLTSAQSRNDRDFADVRQGIRSIEGKLMQIATGGNLSTT